MEMGGNRAAHPEFLQSAYFFCRICRPLSKFIACVYWKSLLEPGSIGAALSTGSFCSLPSSLGGVIVAGVIVAGGVMMTLGASSLGLTRWLLRSDSRRLKA